MSNPLLSVTIGNYNHAHYLPERLSTLLAQLPSEGEIVIVDDASTDNSVEVIEQIAAKDGRLRLILQERNQGAVATANRAFREARGTYVAMWSADDKILPGCFEKKLAVLSAHPDIPLCCSDCGLMYEPGYPDKDPEKIYTTVLLEGAEGVQIFRPKELIKIFRTREFWIPGHTSIIKRDLIAQYGVLDGGLEYLCDWFLLHSIALSYGVAYIPETLSVWLIHAKSYSNALSQDPQRRKAIYWKLFYAFEKENNRHLRSLFRRSTVLHFYVKQLFWQILVRPKYWDFLASISWKVIVRRFQRLLSRATA